MAEPNPEPVKEETSQQPVQVKGGGVMGPIVAAIIIVAGIGVIIQVMVLPVLKEKTRTSVPGDLKANDNGGGADEEPSGSGTSKAALIPYDLGDPIVVNIKGERGMVLSAKVGYMLRSNATETDAKTKVNKKVADFRPMLIDAARGYLTTIQEEDLELEVVHKDNLKRRLNRVFETILNDKEMEGLISRNPVEHVLLPSFTAQ